MLDSEIDDNTTSDWDALPEKNLLNICLLLVNTRIRDFFRDHAKNLPILRSIAKVLLAFPVTSVASESLFSRAGLTIDELRNRLHTDTVEQLT